MLFHSTLLSNHFLIIYLFFIQYGNLTPYVKSEPIPKVNDQPVKVVVADNIDEIVFNSGKNGSFMSLQLAG